MSVPRVWNTGEGRGHGHHGSKRSGTVGQGSKTGTDDVPVVLRGPGVGSGHNVVHCLSVRVRDYSVFYLEHRSSVVDGLDMGIDETTGNSLLLSTETDCRHRDRK